MFKRKDLISTMLALILFTPVPASSAMSQARLYTIQIASASSEAEAKEIVGKLSTEAVAAYYLKAEIPGIGTRFRVRIGRYSNQAEARSDAEQFRKRGLISNYFLTKYEPYPGLEQGLGEPAPSQPAPPARSAEEKPVEKSIEKPASERPITEARPADEKRAPVEAGPAGRADNPSDVHLDLAVKALSNSSKTIEASISIAAAQSSGQTAAASGAGAGDKPLAEPPGELSGIEPGWKVADLSIRSDRNLHSIFFVDSMTGWVAGEGGSVFRTTDGGRSFKPLLIGSNATITSIFFVDWNTGWVLGEASGGENSEGANAGDTILFSTVDGGRTWVRKPLPEVSCLFFVDARIGWAAGRNGTLLKTINGGADWKPVENIQTLIGLPVESTSYNFGFNSIHFADKSHGWVSGNFYGRARNNVGGVFATSDGGETWKRIPITLQAQHSSGRFIQGAIQRVSLSDPMHGTVTGEMIDGEDRLLFVLHTSDGGVTWEQFHTPARAQQQAGFISDSVGWRVVSAPREGSADAVIYDSILMHTDNGGLSWKNIFLSKGRRIRSLAPGWAAGDRGLVLRFEPRSKAN